MAADRSHDRHDRFAIADAIGGGIAPATIRTCQACGALHADLLTLQRAVRDAWLPSRPRDLRLTVAIALRMRRRSWRERLALIGSRRDVITRPVALGFTAVGLAGLLLTSMPAGTLLGSAGAAPAEYGRGSMAQAAGASAAPSAPAGIDQGVESPTIDSAAPPERQNPTRQLSLVLLAIGGSIFVVRRLAPRTDRVR